ncbi:ribosomal protein S9 [Acidimicrobium ferrooxidans DSM 10331]|uniref:Small ribosomal subunit protein uS9 n=1 Tax=Acidimicrobium ferrooxidans (strain DSM 10331 / JCM 15462 / NBRC 103882 / ICP) TaxID=525909 RepID=C7M304_ACIFD|nr:30S ribosomal protein S9 [Acidimicrobium ferrooxidans]ACU53398.1 ribosomal protein S9 [Acidimicrobium ferrooxidans DSM 10331]
MSQTLVQATGRRKTAVARVRLVPGSGSVMVNGKELASLPVTLAQRAFITEPLRLAELTETYDVVARVDGGGVAGQVAALRHGLARAIAELHPELRVRLKREGMLTRDAREKESKKYGLKKARKAPQYSKR